MPTTTANMGLSKPVAGPAGDVDAWAPYLNSDLDLLDAHDHVPGRGVPIKSASLRIDDDVTWAYNGDPWALLGARALGLEPVPGSSVASDRSVFFVDSDRGDELFFKDESGAEIRITNAGALDISLLGGITGDYSTVGADVSYSDADKAYTFRQVAGLGQPWAYLRSGPIDLYQPSTAGITQRVRLQSPNALAASYAVTFPGALPASRAPLHLDSSGNVSTTGDVIVHVTPAGGSGSGWAWDPTNGYLLSSGAGTWSVGIPTRVGWRVKSITFERYGDGAADLTGGINRRHKNATPDTAFSISVTNAAASWTDEVCDISDKDIVDGDSMWVYFTANAANLRIGEIRVTYSHP